jgi:hypothetical protein
MGEKLIDKENVVPHHFNPQGTHVPPQGHVHEDRDVPMSAIIRFAVILAAVCIGSSLALWGMFEFLQSQADTTAEELSPLSRLGEPPPGPRLQPTPGHEDSAMRGLRPMEGGANVVPMPIDSAINLLIERGGVRFTPAAAAAPTGADTAATSAGAATGTTAGGTTGTGGASGTGGGEPPATTP